MLLLTVACPEIQWFQNGNWFCLCVYVPEILQQPLYTRGGDVVTAERLMIYVQIPLVLLYAFKTSVCICARVCVKVSLLLYSYIHGNPVYAIHYESGIILEDFKIASECAIVFFSRDEYLSTPTC